jgi:hypothetical protein
MKLTNLIKFVIVAELFEQNENKIKTYNHGLTKW